MWLDLWNQRRLKAQTEIKISYIIALIFWDKIKTSNVFRYMHIYVSIYNTIQQIYEIGALIDFDVKNIFLYLFAFWLLNLL